MNTRLLIDNVMRQTTVLIAQLSTAAGVRAPLVHVADQVFRSLAREIEAQGVGRKVVADMFGMALRGYQKKTQRLAESQTRQGAGRAAPTTTVARGCPASTRSACCPRKATHLERRTARREGDSGADPEALTGE